MSLAQVHGMGTARDMILRHRLARVDNESMRAKIELARKIVYEKNYAVNTASVESMLKELSLVPTLVSSKATDTNCILSSFALQSVFSQVLGPLGINHYEMFVVDLMHEFEIGVWKALFLHLLRLLQAHDSGLLNELDRRSVIQYRTNNRGFI